MPYVYFVCQGNRARSQMAEAFFNAWAPPGWRALSGGTTPRESVSPDAIALMAEMGIDMTAQRPKPFDAAIAAKAWRVLAMCSLESCPTEVTEKTERWDVADPGAVPKERWPDIRDDIAERVKALIRTIARAVPAD